jgi:hypothetical protein
VETIHNEQGNYDSLHKKNHRGFAPVVHSNGCVSYLLATTPAVSTASATTMWATTRTTSATSATTETSTAALARSAFTSDIDHNLSSLYLRVVEHLNSGLGLLRSSHLNETKSPLTPGGRIENHSR